MGNEGGPPPQHCSVFTLTGKTSDQPGNKPILNAVLALMKYLRSHRDKEHIYNVILSRFNLEALKEAREIIYTYSDPEERYAYRGPYNVSNPREKCAHAFDGIFVKMDELDGKDLMPVIACPSDDMALLLSLHNDPVAVDDRFKKLENEVSEMRKVLAVVTSSAQAAPGDGKSWPGLSSIQPSTRNRLLSESNKRRRTDAGETPGSESEVESSAEDHVPKDLDQRRKWTKVSYSRKLSQNVPSKSNEENPGVKKNNRPKATWGKSKTAASVDLSGPPPEIFMMNCRKTIEEENVRRHFESHGITLVEVKKASHDDARRNSFVLTMANRDDYNKILSGDLIPQDVGVRTYVSRPRRFNPGAGQSNPINDFLRSSSVERSSIGKVTVSKQSIHIPSPIMDTEDSQHNPGSDGAGG